MKKFTLALAAATLAIVPATAAVPSHPLAKAHKARTERALPHKKASASTMKKSPRRPAGETAPKKWMPVSEKAYEWYGSSWEYADQTDFTYADASGNPATSLYQGFDGVAEKTEYKYNDFNMMTQQLVSTNTSEQPEEFTYTSRKDRVYDSMVHNFIVENTEYTWSDGEWVFGGNNYRRIVERNADGNVISVTMEIFFDGAYDPTEKLTITYGADGKATSIKQTALEYDWDTDNYSWVDGEEYSDIVWEETNGQILEIGTFAEGNNRMKSATYSSEGELIGTIQFAYIDDNGSYTATITDEEGVMEEKVVFTDAYGSFVYTLTTSFEDMGETYTITSTNKYVTDEWGHEIVVYEAEDYDGDTEVYMYVRGHVEMNANGEYPDVYWCEMLIPEDEYGDYDMMRAAAAAESDDEEIPGEWENYYKIEYQSWVDVAGVENVAVQPEDAPVEYFNLQGIRVAEPSNGLYIRRCGKNVEKIIIR